MDERPKTMYCFSAEREGRRRGGGTARRDTAPSIHTRDPPLKHGYVEHVPEGRTFSSSMNRLYSAAMIVSRRVGCCCQFLFFSNDMQWLAKSRLRVFGTGAVWSQGCRGERQLVHDVPNSSQLAGPTENGCQRRIGSDPHGSSKSRIKHSLTRNIQICGNVQMMSPIFSGVRFWWSADPYFVAVLMALH